MSTRANIGYEIPGGFKMQYVHYDGYPEHVGRILKEFFNTKALVRPIIDKGQIRALNEDGSVDFFKDNEGCSIYETLQDCMNGFDYVYLLTDKGWTCYVRDRISAKPIIMKEFENA